MRSMLLILALTGMLAAGGCASGKCGCGQRCGGHACGQCGGQCGGSCCQCGDGRGQEFPPVEVEPYTFGPGAPSVAYPYYTTKGPRDFLARSPRGIGR